ncbi:hypothetical protein L204_104594 [Cryptococcus depauperatus]
MVFGLDFMLDGQDVGHKRMVRVLENSYSVVMIESGGVSGGDPRIPKCHSLHLPHGVTSATTSWYKKRVIIPQLLLSIYIFSLFAATSDRMVKEIDSYNEWKSLINGSQVVVFPKLKFVRVDVDAQEKIAHEAQVKAMPTYTAYESGTIIKSCVGAIPQGLEALLRGVS